MGEGLKRARAAAKATRVKPLLRGPAMYPVFRSEAKAIAYAEREANRLDHMMAVEQISARRWKVTDCGGLPPLDGSTTPDGSMGGE